MSSSFWSISSVGGWLQLPVGREGGGGADGGGACGNGLVSMGCELVEIWVNSCVIVGGDEISKLYSCDD